MHILSPSFLFNSDKRNIDLRPDNLTTTNRIISALSKNVFIFLRPSFVKAAWGLQVQEEKLGTWLEKV